MHTFREWKSGAGPGSPIGNLNFMSPKYRDLVFITQFREIGDSIIHFWHKRTMDLIFMGEIQKPERLKNLTINHW